MPAKLTAAGVPAPPPGLPTLATPPGPPWEQRLRSMLPEHATKDPMLAGVLRAQGAACDDAYEALWETFRTFFLKTCGAKGMAYWEWFCQTEPGPGQSLEDRRSAAQAKLLGAGASTVARIAAMVASFHLGDIAVEEHYGAYELTVRFAAPDGPPTGLGALRALIRQFMPAHIGFVTDIVMPSEFLNENALALAALALALRLRGAAGRQALAGFGARAGAAYAQRGVSGTVTMDAMWRLDGEYRLDGSRRLIAGSWTRGVGDYLLDGGLRLGGGWRLDGNLGGAR